MWRAAVCDSGVCDGAVGGNVASYCPVFGNVICDSAVCGSDVCCRDFKELENCHCFVFQNSPKTEAKMEGLVSDNGENGNGPIGKKTAAGGAFLAILMSFFLASTLGVRKIIKKKGSKNHAKNENLLTRID